MRHHHVTIRAFVLTCLTFAAAPAFGGGIEVPMQSAAAAGQADAFTAQADDASAIFYNPAGLSQLSGTNISAGAFYLQPEFHFDGANGSNERENLPALLPHVYVESNAGLDRFRFGLGIDNTFGVDEDWGNTGPLRTLVDQAQLSVINIAPTMAYRVNNALSLGMAFNIYYGDLLLTRNVPLGLPPTPEGSFHLRGSAEAFGVTPGLLWKIDDRNTFGAYYRSPFSLDFDGNASLAMGSAGTMGPSPAKAALELPQSAGIGYAIRPTPPLKVEADAIWTDWHAVNELQIRSSNPAFNGQTIPADWNSGFTFRLGTEYKLSDRWTLRGGYAYSQNAVPNSTFSPLVPDSNYHLFSLGAGYAMPAWRFDVAGIYIYRERHHVADSVDSPIVDGEWSNQMFGVMATVTFHL